MHTYTRLYRYVYVYKYTRRLGNVLTEEKLVTLAKTERLYYILSVCVGSYLKKKKMWNFRHDIKFNTTVIPW